MDYFELQPKDNTFKTISVQTTYRCQIMCANCYLGNMLNNDNIPDLDRGRFKKFLNDLPGRCDIRFIGAEPTMNPQLFELIQDVRSSKHRPSLLTNGLKLRKLEYVEDLKYAGVNMLGLSMNGGLDNDVYKRFDGGRYAKLKSIALNNCFKCNILPHVNVILDPSNTHVIKPLVDFMIDSAEEHNRKFSRVKFPVMLRVKSIGKMGYYMDSRSFSMNEMVEILEDELQMKIKSTTVVNGYEETKSLIYEIPTRIGPLLGKITDWTVDDEGIPDAGSHRRGILTDDFTIAPFFEYYKRHLNETR